MLTFFKKSQAFYIILQKSFGTEMEYISNGKIKVISSHPRTQKVRNYFSPEVFWSWFLIHWKPDYLPRCTKVYTVSLIHNCPIKYNFCLLLLNNEDFYIAIFPLVFSKPSSTCSNRTLLWVSFLSKCIFQWMVL